MILVSDKPVLYEKLVLVFLQTNQLKPPRTDGEDWSPALVQNRSSCASPAGQEATVVIPAGHLSTCTRRGPQLFIELSAAAPKMAPTTAGELGGGTV